MERTKYFDNTKPTDTQLNWTETSRTHAITARMRAGAQFGIVSGFQVTVNGTDPTRLDVAGGTAYSGGNYTTEMFEGQGAGERTSTEVLSPSGAVEYDTAATSVGLVDYTNTVNNYISLVYAEVESYPLAERFYPFTNRDTVVTESFTVSVLSKVNWDALSALELNKRVLVAIVTANGAGVALTNSSINQFMQPKTHPYSTQPSTLTGVTILSVSDETYIGSGSLRYDSSVSSLYWTAPGDAEGTGVAIPSSGNYTLYSDSVAYSILVEVIYANFPAAATIETIYIRSLYGREIPMFSAVDTAHRDMLGTGALTLTNVHALSLNDISEGTFDHADLFHINGISSDADDTQLGCSILAINEQILVNNVGSFRNSFLVDGITYTSLTGVVVGGTGVINFNIVPLPTTGEYLIYVDSAGEVQKVLIGTSLWTTTIKIVDIENTAAGDGEISWDAAARTLDYTAPGDVAGTGDVVYVMDNEMGGTEVEGYYKLYSGTRDNWVLVFCDGDLGITQSTTFAIEKNSTDNPDEAILKLCVVNWVSGTSTLADVRDLRKFVTADTSPLLLEEHDAAGNHTRVLAKSLHVAAYGYGVYGSAHKGAGVIGEAASRYGVAGYAQTGGVYGTAVTNTGVRGIAGVDYGVEGSAAGSYGVYGTAVAFGVFGTATSIGVCGSALSNCGVFGQAVSSAIKGQAAASIGVFGYAVSNTGVYGQALDNTGVHGKANDNYGVYGEAVASDYGVYGTAGRDYGVYGKAVSSFGVFGRALSYGVKGQATSYGVIGDADKYGVHGTAINVAVYGNAEIDTGVYGYASTDYGVKGEAAESYGVYGVASTMGVYGTANEAGVYGSASTSGVEGSASVSIGVYGSAPNYGVKGVAGEVGTPGNFGVIGTAYGNNGVYGSASGILGVAGVASDTAVYGEAANNYGVRGSAGVSHGVYGQAATIGVAGVGVTETGVYGYAPVTGVYGNVLTDYGVYGEATVSFGVYGTARNYGVFGSAGAGGYGLGGQGSLVGVHGVGSGGINAVGVFGSGVSIGVVGTGVIGASFKGTDRGIICSNTFEYAITTTSGKDYCLGEVPISVVGLGLPVYVKIYSTAP